MTDIVYMLVVTVRDVPGILVRIAQVFARRGCNIRSLHVEPQADGQWSEMTIVVHNVARMDQVVAQLEKLVDVASVREQHRTLPEGGAS